MNRKIGVVTFVDASGKSGLPETYIGTIISWDYLQNTVTIFGIHMNPILKNNSTLSQEQLATIAGAHQTHKEIKVSFDGKNVTFIPSWVSSSPIPPKPQSN